MSTSPYERYVGCYKQSEYTALQEAIADALHHAFDDPIVETAMNRVTDTAKTLCGYSMHKSPHLELAIFCQAHHLPLDTINLIRDYLQGFASGQTVLLDDFYATAKALLSPLALLKNSTSVARWQVPSTVSMDTGPIICWSLPNT